MRLGAIDDWFAGGSTPGMPLIDCMNGDAPRIAPTVAPCAGVAGGDLNITLHRWRNQAQGADLALDVIGTGIGIRPEDQAHLFEDFYQVQNRERDRTKGFGLGLAITDRPTRQLDGEMALRS